MSSHKAIRQRLPIFKALKTERGKTNHCLEEQSHVGSPLKFHCLHFSAADVWVRLSTFPPISVLLFSSRSASVVCWWGSKPPSPWLYLYVPCPVLSMFFLRFIRVSIFRFYVFLSVSMFCLLFTEYKHMNEVS